MVLVLIVTRLIMIIGTLIFNNLEIYRLIRGNSHYYPFLHPSKKTFANLKIAD